MSEYQQDVFYSSSTTCVVLKKVYQKLKDNMLIDNKLDLEFKKINRKPLKDSHLHLSVRMNDY